METAVEIFAIITFTVIGLSHVIRPRAWAEFFQALAVRGRPAAFLNGFLALLPGGFIVAFHDVWTGLPVVLTVVGWLLVLKGALVFLFPELGLRSMRRVTPERSRLFILPGLFYLVIAGLLAFAVFRRFMPW